MLQIQIHRLKNSWGEREKLLIIPNTDLLSFKERFWRWHIYKWSNLELLIFFLRLPFHTTSSRKDLKYFAGNSYKIFISWIWTFFFFKAFIFSSNGDFSCLVKEKIKGTSCRSVAKAIIYTRCLWTISTFYHHPNLCYQMAKFI